MELCETSNFSVVLAVQKFAHCLTATISISFLRFEWNSLQNDDVALQYYVSEKKATTQMTRYSKQWKDYTKINRTCNIMMNCVIWLNAE